MSEQEGLWRVAGVIIVITIWGYANFSTQTHIVKERDKTQMLINTGVALFFIYGLLEF